MSVAGWVAAGDAIRLPMAADVTITMAVTESVNGAPATAVNLTGKTVTFTVQRHVGDRTDPLLVLSSTDPSPKLTIISATAGTVQIVFVPTHFPTALSGSYRLDLKAGTETVGRPYGSGQFTVDAT